MSDEALRERYRIAIVADPQLTDWMSYHQSGLLLALVETYTDIYMKRSFNRMHASLRPDAVLFLGDLNDGGRDSYGETFDKNSNRFFEKVFETNVRLYVAGNHDVGFGNTLVRPSVARFKRVFGSINYEIEVGNHSLVVLDTLALSSDVRDIREESQQFLTQMKNEKPTLPRILFTHVPLFRLDTTYCGDARETEQLIINRNGLQFQNMVNAPLSRQILRGIQPDMVFSGDDHDWCEIAHSLDGTLTPEVTLPTFSFAQGIQQPGFVMLSLYNPEHKGSADSVARPSEDTTFAYEECMLPNQMLIYMCYIALLAFSLNCILIQRYRWMMRGRRHLAERSVLLRWTDSSTCPSDSDATPQGSTTATAISSQRQQQQQSPAQQDRLNDEYGGSGSPGYFENAVVGRKQKKNVWPLLSSIYWKMSVWDLWNIVRYVVPFYAFLFVVSII
ncbi:Metallo-dependent phosphatase-like protein [Dissophora ornata]|nr:Metallo-dependent phosphatase-like protein [Dissophora ornata]